METQKQVGLGGGDGPSAYTAAKPLRTTEGVDEHYVDKESSWCRGGALMGIGKTAAPQG